jgi:general nucleoside transport system permease protein
MTSATPEPEGTAPSTDKSPPQREEGRPYYMSEVKPVKHRGDKTFSQRLREELYADNTFTVTVLAVVLALVVGAVLMVLGNEAVRQQWSYFFYQPLKTLEASWDFIAKAYTDMFKGSIVNPETLNRWFWGMTTWQQVLRPISETLTNAAPLILTGLAVAIPFRAGLFNIGGQGQAIMGAIGAGTIGILLDLPAIINLPLALIVGILCGGLWGGLVGVLKAKTGAHEVITTIMLNLIAGLFLSWYILQSGIKDPARSDAISKEVHGSSLLPKIFDPSLRVSLSIVLALLAAWAMAWLLNRGRFGFELRAVGYNPHAASTAGMNVGTTVALTMALAGALAGLGGATMVLGTAAVLTNGVVGQIGFNGILVALLGRVKPWGVAAAGILFGALQSGGQAMQTFSGVSNELVTVIQAMIVIFVAAPMLVKAIFRLRKSPSEAASAVMAKG